jgi:hypothetical protein
MCSVEFTWLVANITLNKGYHKDSKCNIYWILAGSMLHMLCCRIWWVWCWNLCHCPRQLNEQLFWKKKWRHTQVEWHDLHFYDMELINLKVQSPVISLEHVESWKTKKNIFYPFHRSYDMIWYFYYKVRKVWNKQALQKFEIILIFILGLYFVPTLVFYEF